MGSLWKANGNRNGMPVRITAGSFVGEAGVICRRLVNPVSLQFCYVVKINQAPHLRVQCSVRDLEMI